MFFYKSLSEAEHASFCMLQDGELCRCMFTRHESERVHFENFVSANFALDKNVLRVARQTTSPFAHVLQRRIVVHRNWRSSSGQQRLVLAPELALGGF